MGTIMKVNHSDHVVSVALYHYSFKWDRGRLLAGGRNVTAIIANKKEGKNT